ncbi:MAG: type II secretion system F family protein, partial [Planctomycetota bacterium]|nr:type II secretion system F family protein [Planctomycetota bacterium]
SMFIVFYLSTPGRLAIDRLALRIPIIGKIFRLAGTVTFAQSLSVLLRSGISVIEGLLTVEQMHYNQFLAGCVRNSRENVTQGRSLASALSNSQGYMPLLPNMTAVGEQVGNLDEVMDEVATFHDEQLKTMIKSLSAWVTPATTIIVGSIVGYVYIAFFLALFAVAS